MFPSKLGGGEGNRETLVKHDIFFIEHEITPRVYFNAFSEYHKINNNELVGEKNEKNNLFT